MCHSCHSAVSSTYRRLLLTLNGRTSRRWHRLGWADAPLSESAPASTIVFGSVCARAGSHAITLLPLPMFALMPMPYLYRYLYHTIPGSHLHTCVTSALNRVKLELFQLKHSMINISTPEPQTPDLQIQIWLALADCANHNHTTECPNIRALKVRAP